ncbi:Uncharacterised protein [uncultured archaeon]|nr:Uncharacterised protein [uncultured archaeon]
MVYKKYIKKDGKLYGPYNYQSHRINGKIISEYCGTAKPNYRKFAFLIIGIFLLVLLASSFLIFNGKVTGNAVADNQLSSQTENALINESGITIYPKVYFTLVFTQEETASPSNETSSEIKETNNEPNPSAENTTEIPASEENNTLEDSENENTTAEQTPVETQNSETETTDSSKEQTQTSETDTSSEQTQETNGASQEQPASETETTSPEQTSDTTDALTEQIPETTSTSTESDSSSEQSSAPETSAPITGGVISRILKTVSNFFLSLGLTGNAVSEQSVKKISGQASFNESFTYNLKEGESLKLLSGSVKTDSKSLPDNAVKITYQDNSVLVSTDYSEFIKSNASEEKIKVNINVNPLSDEERKILLAEFGNASIETIKSELFNNRYVVGYKLGDYTIEYSYDSELSNETLNSQMEIDRTKWLRDIINKISAKENTPQQSNFASSNISL